MNVNDDLLFRAIQHQIYVERYGRGLADKIVRLLNSADKDIVETLAKRLIDIDKRGYDLGPKTTKDIEALLAEVRFFNEEVYGKLAAGLTVELEGLAQHSAETAADGLKAAIPISTTIALPSASYLKHLVEVAPLAGTQLKPWIKRLSDSRIGQIEDRLRTGLVTGKTTDQMVRDIRGPGGVFEGSRKSAQTMVLTAVAGVQNAARDAVYQRNAHLIKGVRYVSVLDTRTTSICQSRDGQFYPLDKPRPALPAHPRCRSTYAPVTKSVDELGNVTEAEGSRYRASMDGRVPGKTTYGDWLSKQPADRQDSILGPERAKLFRDGKVAFKDLYRDDGSYRSLDELRRAEGQAAKRPAASSPKPKAAKPAAPKVDIAKIDAEEREYCVTKGKTTGVEHLVAYDTKTGQNLARKKGQKSAVTLPPELVDAISNPDNAIVLHHNHPSSSSFSTVDLALLSRFPGASAIWAHAHNGSSFYAERGAFPFKEATAKAMSASVQGKLQNLLNRGAVSYSDAVLMTHHLTWMAVHDLGQIVYKAQLDGPSKAAFDRNRKVFENLLESLK